MRYSAEARATVPKHLNGPTPFVTSLARTTVEHIIEVRIFDMELMWIDSNNRAYWVRIRAQKNTE